MPVAQAACGEAMGGATEASSQQPVPTCPSQKTPWQQILQAQPNAQMIPALISPPPPVFESSTHDP